MIITLKILGLVIASVGAALAIFGESRSKGRLTRLGKAALLLVVAGLLTSATLELRQWLEDKRKQEIDRQWSDTLNQTIMKMGLTFYFRQEIRPSKLIERWREAFVGFGSVAARRRLFLREHSEEENAEKRIRLVVLDSDDRVVGIGDRLNLKKREFLQFQNQPTMSRGSTQTTDTPKPSGTPPQALPKIITGTVIAESFEIRGWPYTSFADHDWTDPEALTCGFETKISWKELKLDDEVQSVRDFGRLAVITVSLPIDFDLKPIDRFDIAIITSDQQVLWLRIASLQFHNVDDKRMVADISGYEWLTRIEEEFREQGGRAPVGMSF
jgi:hypothetical protein